MTRAEQVSALVERFRADLDAIGHTETEVASGRSPAVAATMTGGAVLLVSVTISVWDADGEAVAP